MAFSYDFLPPIVPDMLPAFQRNKIKLFFTLSQSTDIQIIQGIEFKIISQYGDKVYIENNFINYVPIKNIYKCTEADDLLYGDHYIIIDTSTLDCDIFYKVQFRFYKGKDLTTIIDLNNFSEWSAVCLIKKLKETKITIQGLDLENTKNTLRITSLPNPIKGTFVYSGDNKEKLKNVQIVLRNDSEYFIQEQSDYIAGINNTFSYQLKTLITDAEHYRLIIYYTTTSGYKGTQVNHFVQISTGVSENPADLYLSSNSQIGTIDVQIYIPSFENYQGNFIIRRTSAESQYKTWEDIKIIQFISNGDNANTTKVTLNNVIYDVYTWSDRTIKSGIYYKYGIAPLQENGWRGTFVFTQDSEMCIFDDIFLMGDNKQLRVRFNPTISNFKYNVTESINATLGAKYPYIRRNGHNYYRSFSIGGLITTYMDTTTESMVDIEKTSAYSPNATSSQSISYPDKSIFKDFVATSKDEQLKQFTSKDELFNFNKEFSNNNPKQKMQTYNSTNDIAQYEDIIYEREFREKVYEFLYQNTVKLFRSNTEGNMLIKLTNITFSPMDQLGRQLYSFSAEAIEIAEYSIFNCNKYNIQNIGKYTPIVNIENIPGQYVATYNANIENVDIFDNIVNKIKREWKYNQSNTVKSKYKPPQLKGHYNIKVPYLTKLRIEISSPPFPIVKSSNGGFMYTQDGTSKTAILGYIMNLNNEQIIIKATQQRRKTNYTHSVTEYDGLTESLSNMSYNSVYEIYDTLPLNTEKITKLTFLSPPNLPLTIQVDYIAHVSATFIEPSSVMESNFYNPGQLWGTFSPNENLMELIQEKGYYYTQINKNEIALNMIDTQNKDIIISNTIDKYRYISQVKCINFDTIPNAVIYLRTTNHIGTGGENLAMNYSRHIAANGFINFNSENILIQDCYFGGIHLSQTDRNQPRLDEFKYDGDTIYNSFQSIENPQNNVVYNVLSYELTTNTQNAIIQPSSIQNDDTLILNAEARKYIYFRNQWFLFKDENNENDVLCPVDAIINYIYQGTEVGYQNIESKE